MTNETRASKQLSEPVELVVQATAETDGVLPVTCLSSQSVEFATATVVTSAAHLEYELIELVGQGGMGTVYKTLNRKTGTLMAIKFVKPELLSDAMTLKRFEQEVKAASELSHPNLAAVYDHGRTGGGAPFLVMDYIEGEGLDSVIDRLGPLPTQRAVDIFIEIAEGLMHAHQKGIIHRDIKPANILITGEGDATTSIKVVDFGIAKIVQPVNPHTNRVTQTAAVLGSPTYMSPEQCLGETLDARSDIYSLGCVMYETVTGEPPFVGENVVQTIVKQLSEKPSLSNIYATHDRKLKGLGAIIERALSKDRGLRYQSMDQLKGDLLKLKFGKPPARPLNRATIISLGAGVAVTAICLAGWMVGDYMRHQVRPDTPPVPQESDGKIFDRANRDYQILDYQHKVVFEGKGESLGQVLAQAIKAEVSLDNADFSGASFSNNDSVNVIDGGHFAHATFSGADLRGLSFSDCDLSNADFTGAHLPGSGLAKFTLFNRCNIKGSTLTGCILTGAAIEASDLSGSRLNGSDLHYATISNSNLANVNMIDANISSTVFKNCNLSHARMRQDYFKDAKFISTDLSSINASFSIIGPAEFNKCKLAEANFKGSKLADITFGDCNADAADFSDCSIGPAEFRACTFKKVDFKGAKMTETSFRNCVQRDVLATKPDMDMSVGFDQ